MALDLPGEDRRRLAEWRDGALAGRGDLRPVAPEALHVTLAFVGHRPEEEVGPIAATIVDSCAGLCVARLRSIGVVAVPPRRPRLLALDLADEGGRAGAVQAVVSEALVAGGWYAPEKRPFWPHVTLARVRRGERALPLVARPPEQAFDAGAVTLYRSLLSPRGARYEAIECVRLRATG